jgi:anti-sigma B factor antagonist
LRLDGDDGSAAVVHIIGELDLATAPTLRETLARLYQDGTTSVVLDLTDLDFVDSTGLSEFVVALKRCRERGGDVVLRSPSRSTARVLTISGLDRVFTIVSGTGAASAG